MYAKIYDRIKNDPEFIDLVQKRRAFSIKLTFIMLSIFFAFILTIALNPAFFAQKLFEGSTTTIGIPIAISIIVAAFTLTGIYVKKANGTFDIILNRIKKRLGNPNE